VSKADTLLINILHCILSSSIRRLRICIYMQDNSLSLSLSLFLSPFLSISSRFSLSKRCTYRFQGGCTVDAHCTLHIIVHHTHKLYLHPYTAQPSFSLSLSHSLCLSLFLSLFLSLPFSLSRSYTNLYTYTYTKKRSSQMNDRYHIYSCAMSQRYSQTVALRTHAAGLAIPA